MRSTLWLMFVVWVLVAASGCGSYDRQGVDPVRAQQLTAACSQRWCALTREREARILALNPERVTGRDLLDTLSNAPAPRIINIHGGNREVISRMVSFSEFLMGMGYPGASITNPGDGTYTFSCYESSRKTAGAIAWYYERERMRPMMIGHSQGGFQAVKVLQLFAANPPEKLRVWNPLTWKEEDRQEITDPLTGRKRPVAGLQLPYATSVGAGGLTRFLPNQWDMAFTLRSIPDSVEEFTGFYKGWDLLGGDYLGYGAANRFKAKGTARVRNVELPAQWKHGAVPDTRHLLKSQAVKDRINDYMPSGEAFVSVPSNAETLNPDILHLFWAEDVWFSIKKHWVLELQRWIRAKRESHHDQ
jgi:hypothetical protein